MKRIQVTVTDECFELMEKIELELGHSKSQTIRLAILAYGDRQKIRVQREKAPQKSEKEAMDDEAKEKEEYITTKMEGYQQHQWMCPMHPDRYADMCGCLQNGNLLKRILNQ